MHICLIYTMTQMRTNKTFISNFIQKEKKIVNKTNPNTARVKININFCTVEVPSVLPTLEKENRSIIIEI